MRGAYGCNYSWRFQWHHRRPCPTSAAGDITDLSRFAERTDLCRQYSLSLIKNLLAVTLTKANNLSTVSLTPAMNFSPVSLILVRNNQKATTPPKTRHRRWIFPRCRWYWSEITKKQQHRRKHDTGDEFFVGIVDTGDKTVLPILASLATWKWKISKNSHGVLHFYLHLFFLYKLHRTPTLYMKRLWY